MKRRLGAGSWCAVGYILPTGTSLSGCTFEARNHGFVILEDDRQRTERERVEQLFAGLREAVTR